jgi:hypothetical protein
MIETDVLIVGGSLVGLSAATFLAWHGVPTLSVERHHGTAVHPRAGHFHLRTLEVFRSVGLEARVRAASEEQFDPDGGINAVESLAGKEIATYIANLNEGVAAISPSTRLFMTQQSLEPLIRERAEELGAAMRYATELTAFEQDAGGVTSFIRNVLTGETDTVRAKYMIAADGNRSPIRAQLGIGTSGPGHLAECVTIYFHADCGAALRGRNLGVIYVFNTELRGFFRLVRTGDSGFLAVMTRGDMSRPDALTVGDGIDKESSIAFVRAAIGIPDVNVAIGDIAIWRAVAEVAERFTEGPCLSGRRRRPRDAADGRLWRQYRRSRHAQSRLEARPGAQRRRRLRTARDLRRRAATGRRTCRPTGLYALCAARRP